MRADDVVVKSGGGVRCEVFMFQICVPMNVKRLALVGLWKMALAFMFFAVMFLWVL